MSHHGSPSAPADAAPVVVIPVKAFRQAKLRLADHLDEHERIDLARSMASGVIRAAAGMDVRVVCDDPEVTRWAHSTGAGVIEVSSSGLNAAVTEALQVLQGEGVDLVMICHGDLPLATSLHGIGKPGLVTIVPDRHLQGTNVLVVPTRAGFSFHYGPGSLHRHVEEALRCGLDVEIHQIAALQWDVDTPDDLDDQPPTTDEGASA